MSVMSAGTFFGSCLHGKLKTLVLSACFNSSRLISDLKFDSMSIDLSSEPIAQTGVQQFCVEMMNRLDIQRRNEHFCDVILEVGSGDHQARLKAHKIVLCAASPFFYNALNSDMKEKKEGVIRLEEINKAVMEQVLEFVYTGRVVDVTQHNAFDLLEVAEFFVIPSLKAVSSKFISQTLSSSNCLLAYYSAERYHCPELQKEARDFAFANFMSLTGSEYFLNLNIEQVEEWISSDEIKVKEEEDVFQVILKWLERNNGEEGERFFELFRHVRIVYLSRSFVFTVILHHPLVKNSESCMAFVLDALKEVSSGTEECYFAQPPRSCLKMHEDALVACGKKKTICYLPSENKWYEMADMLFERGFPTGMSACHGKLYNIGGYDPPENAMDRYDPSGNSWTPVQSYNDARACKVAAIVSFQGFLFVIGGKNENGVNGNVHKYNPETNMWQEVPPLSFARCGVCAVADRNSIFAIGGKLGGEFLDVVEKFDPERNCWNQIASTIERKMLSCGAISRDKVFLFGGFTSFQPPFSGTSLIEMYDPVLNEWTGIQSMGPPEHCFGAVTFKGEVFVSGKWTEDSSTNFCLKVYDVDKNEWKLCASIPHGFNTSCLAPLRIPRDIFNSCRVVQ